MRSVSLAAGILILLAIGGYASFRSISPAWAAGTRLWIAEEAVERIWDEGVRLVWSGGGEFESKQPGNLSVRIQIPTPSGEVEVVFRGAGG